MTAKQKGDSDLHPACLWCGCNLIRLKWNEKFDMLVCDNWHCPKYHQPAGTVTANSYDEDEDAKKIKALTENF